MKSFFQSQCSRPLGFGGLILAVTLNVLAGPHEGYRQTNLVADQTGVARFADTNLVNPWGILASGGHLIVADNHAGVTTFYNRTGQPTSLAINVPAPDGSPGGAVTDVAMNPSKGSFVLSNGTRHRESILLFVTEDGTISGWNPEVDPHSAVIAVDHSAMGAIYKSLAVAAEHSQPRLYAANFGAGVVEMYNARFQLVRSFTDTSLASSGYVPFGVRAIGGQLFVTYAFKASQLTVMKLQVPAWASWMNSISRGTFCGGSPHRELSMPLGEWPWLPATSAGLAARCWLAILVTEP